MQFDFGSLDVAGYENQRVPNTFITQQDPTRHLGIILPGYHYSPDMAPLHYAGRILLEQGADVLQLEYAYFRTGFAELPESERNEWLSKDVFTVCNAGLAHRAYEKITLIGKSLGTLAIGHLLGDSRFQQAACVWATPLLKIEWLCSRIEQIHPSSFFMIGTADQHYQPEVLQRLERATQGHSLIMEDVDHSLEVPGDIPKSLAALNQMVKALQAFL